jgi:SAM-dependent methyltransferase
MTTDEKGKWYIQQQTEVAQEDEIEVKIKWRFGPASKEMEEVYEWFEEFLLEDYKAGINNLNLGCGINSWIEFREPHTWVNLDIDPSCFRNRSLYNGIVADAHHLPFKTDAFQYTLASEVLEHVDDPVQVLKEIRKICPRLKLSVPDGLLKILMRLMNVEYPFIKDHKRYYTRSLLKKHLLTAGWHIRKIRKDGSISVLGKRFKFGNHFIALCDSNHSE